MPSETSIRTIESDDYADIIDSKGLVIVAMGAQWCGLWRAFLPTFADMAMMLENGDMAFVTCDLERNPAIALLEGITRIPSIVMYRDGQRMGTHVGTMSEAELLLSISEALEPILRET